MSALEMIEEVSRLSYLDQTEEVESRIIELQQALERIERSRPGYREFFPCAD